VGKAIPVVVSPVRPSPSLQRHAAHCNDIPDTVGAHGDRTSPCLALCLVWTPVDGTLKPVRRWRPDGQPLRRHPRSRSCLGIGRATTPWLDEIRQDGRQLRRTARHAFTRRRIVRHTCKLPPPWPVKGGAAPQPRGTRDSGQRSHTRFPRSPRYWHPPQSIPLGLGGQASSPTTLVAPLYEHHGAKQYSAPSTSLPDVRPRPEPG
jgi:hypothetical protein